MGPLKAGGKGKKKKGGNAGVGVDFKRVKHKVGKKLPAAQNETDVDFTSKTIHMPSQAMQQDKEGLNVNCHNLTFQELLAQTSHYSEKARKHALVGLADLFQRHREEVLQHAHQLFPKLAERLGDPDSAVRASLRALLREQVMPVVAAGAVRPFMPIIMAHVCGAMTNLNMEVRLDALNFLDVLMDFVPELVAGGFMSPCLHHFCDLLSQSHRGRNIKSQSLSSLLKVLTALNSFLQRAFCKQAADNSEGRKSTAGGAVHDQDGVPPALGHERCKWAPRDALLMLREKRILQHDDAGLNWDVQPEAVQRPTATPHSNKNPVRQAIFKTQTGQNKLGGKNGGTAAGLTGSQGADKQALAWKLLGLLFTVWAECSPGQVSTAPELESVKALGLILNAVSLLTSHVLLMSKPQSSLTGGNVTKKVQLPRDIAALTKSSELILKQVAPNFPATAPGVKPNAELAEALVKYNLAAAQVLVQLLPVSMHLAAAAPQDQNSTPSAGSGWVETLIRYLTGVLDHGMLIPAKGMLSEVHGSPQQVPTASYELLLQHVSSAIPLVGPRHAHELVSAVSRLAARSHSKSAVRACCVQVQRQLMASYQQGELLLEEAMVVGWLHEVPKLLWEVGASNPELTIMALHMLHATSCCAMQGSMLAASLAGLQQQLPPLFCASIPHPAKKQKLAQAGAEGARGGTAVAGMADSCAVCTAAVEKKQDGGSGTVTQMLVAGPLSKAEVRIQELAIDMLYHLGPLDRTLLKALLPALETNVLPDVAALRLAQVITDCLPDTEPTSVLGWLLSVLFSKSQAGSSDIRTGPCTWERRRSIAELVCRSIPSWAPASVVLKLLGSQLVAVLQQQGGAQGLTELQCYSLLRLNLAAAMEVEGGSSQHPLAGKELPLAVKDAVPMALLNLFLAYTARTRRLHQEHSASAPEPALCMDLLKASPNLTVLVLEAASLRACEGQKAAPAPAPSASTPKLQGKSPSKSKQQQQQQQQEQTHSPVCARATFLSVAQLVQQVLRLQPLRPTLLAHRERVEASVQDLATFANQDGRLSGDQSCQAEATRLTQSVKHIFAAS